MSSEEEDEDLKRAIALSLGEEETTTVSQPPLDAAESPDISKPASTAVSRTSVGPTSMPGLNRAAMEAERLARQAARGVIRYASISPPASLRASKKPRIEDQTEVAHSTASATASTAISPARFNAGIQATAMQKGRSALSQTPASVTASISLSDTFRNQDYKWLPNGKLFKTWAFGKPRDRSDIKIEEVLERSTLKQAVISSYAWDFGWFFTKINTQTTKLQFVIDRSTGGKALAGNLQELSPNVKVCVPESGMCMHSKLMLLVHPTKLRVVVPSANLVSYDWGETGQMENTVWIIDLPRRPDPSSDGVLDETPKSSFHAELEYFLTKQGLPPEVIRGLQKFDWQATKPFAFVHTVAGTHYGSDMARTGLTGFSTAVRQLGLSSTLTQVDMCASSLGALDKKQMSLLYAAARGDLHPSSGRIDLDRTYKNLDASFRLYFPSHQYVASSPGGVGSGGTIYLNKNYYERATFPSQLLYQYRSVRGNLLSHCKMLFARGTTPKAPPAHKIFQGLSQGSKDAEKLREKRRQHQVAHVYAGSANCSAAAWGQVTVERKGAQKGQAKIWCRNWECGVLIPILGPNIEQAALKGPVGRDPAGRQISSRVEHPSSSQRSVTIDPDETESEPEESNDENNTGRTKGAQSGEAAETGRIEPVAVPGWDVFKSVIHGPFQWPSQPMGNEMPWHNPESFGQMTREDGETAYDTRGHG